MEDQQCLDETTKVVSLVLFEDEGEKEEIMWLVTVTKIITMISIYYHVPGMVFTKHLVHIILCHSLTSSAKNGNCPTL